MKHWSVCGRLLLPQVFSATPVRAASPNPTDCSAVSSPAAAAQFNARGSSRAYVALWRCMALFARCCPEGTEVSDKIAEGLILQQGLRKVVMSPVTWASQPFGLAATAPGRRGPSGPRPWQQAGLPPSGSRGPPAENLSSKLEF